MPGLRHAVPGPPPAPGVGHAGDDRHARRAGLPLPRLPAGFFPPPCPPLRLDNHAYSPGALRLIVLLAARLGSFADAAFALTETGLPISAQHVRTLAQQVGGELVGQRDRQADQDRNRLPVRVAATLRNSQAFGRMVAAEAKERDFYRAPRKAFVADGAPYNWKLHQRYFSGFVPIADFRHVVCYVYRSACAVASDEAKRWDQYVAWLRGCWQGRVAGVIGQLRDWQGRIGLPPPGQELPPAGPRRAVAEALSYFGNNAGRMTYPEYRRAGLPVTSSLVESLVGEVNARVKSKQKYWNRGAGAEAILQLRAALLSEDGRLDRYLGERPGWPYRRRQELADHTAPAETATSQTC